MQLTADGDLDKTETKPCWVKTAAKTTRLKTSEKVQLH